METKPRLLIFSQPFPMGNYHLNSDLAKQLADEFECFMAPQFNSKDLEFVSEQSISEVRSVKPDVLFYEMLDEATFLLVEKAFPDIPKVLLVSSPGIFKTFDALLEQLPLKFGTWFDVIVTNSMPLHVELGGLDVPSKHFNYYHSVVSERDMKVRTLYTHDCVFLGQGFGRMSSETYTQEQEMFFHDDSPAVLYGIGWKDHPRHLGILPAGDIGTLYRNANSAIAIIAAEQVKMRSINNRYIELASSGCPIISRPYLVDWKGLEKFIFFVETREDFERAVELCSLFTDAERTLYAKKLKAWAKEAQKDTIPLIRTTLKSLL